ncbi:MAG: hypothetical protein KDE47_04155, partial [Caldilineaceae bacterium]|nr:hypothetical protein [Caldilineaceae bacterium]
MKHPSKLFTLLGLLLALVLVMTACAAPAPAGDAAAPAEAEATATPAESGDAAATESEGGYTIGVSNTLVGNGWREQMICAIKAEATASGLVDRVVVVNRNGGPTEQIADLESLIS